MADPTKFTPGYNYSDFQATQPNKPKPGDRLDTDFANIATSIDEIVEAVKDVRRSDGALKNGIVTEESLAAGLMNALVDGALTEAEAAKVAAEQARDTAQEAAGAAEASADRVDLGALDAAVFATGQDAAATLADRTQTALDRAAAEAARVGAELAGGSAAVAATVYASIAAGLAATSVGQQFAVQDTTAQVLIRYRVDAGPVAVEVTRTPLSSAVAHVYAIRGPVSAGVTAIGGTATVYATRARTMTNIRAALDAGSALATVEVNGLIVRQFTASPSTLLTGLSIPIAVGDRVDFTLSVLSGAPTEYSFQMWG